MRYVRAPLGPGGTAPTKGDFDFVHAPDDATRMSLDDAEYFHGKAFVRSPELDWQVFFVGEGRYIVGASVAVGRGGLTWRRHPFVFPNL